MARVGETRMYKLFWQQNVLQYKHMQNKEMEDNIKMHRSDIGITGVQPSDSARDRYDFLS
jgi:hypothetical protein